MYSTEEEGDFEELNKTRIQAVEKYFNSKVPLLIEGRQLVAKGILGKVCRKANKARTFVLFNDILLYGDPKQQHILPLETMSVEDVVDTADQKNAWQIKHPLKSFTVVSETQIEKTNWVSTLEKLIAIKQTDLLRDGKWKRVEESPVWVPDKLVTKCQHCNKVFGSLTRRHHCRKCGGVFCNACSKYRLVLPDQSNKPLRVCLTCRMMEEESTNPGEKMPENDEQEDRYSSNDDSSFDSDGDILDEQPIAVAYESNSGETNMES